MDSDIPTTVVVWLFVVSVFYVGYRVLKAFWKRRKQITTWTVAQKEAKIFDTENWLSEHGLGEYYDALVENDVTTPEALRRLDEDDLREIGVASLGHRKRFLDGISSLNQPNRIAYAALILGVVSLFLSEFWPIPAAALIVGIWGYQVSKYRSGKGRSMAIAGGALGVVYLFVSGHQHGLY
jgi:hypothetical protein